MRKSNKRHPRANWHNSDEVFVPLMGAGVGRNLFSTLQTPVDALGARNTPSDITDFVGFDQISSPASTSQFSQ